jgi:hypothetical protein
LNRKTIRNYTSGELAANSGENKVTTDQVNINNTNNSGPFNLTPNSLLLLQPVQQLTHASGSSVVSGGLRSAMLPCALVNSTNSNNNEAVIKVTTTATCRDGESDGDEQRLNSASETAKGLHFYHQNVYHQTFYNHHSANNSNSASTIGNTSSSNSNSNGNNSSNHQVFNYAQQYSNNNDDETANFRLLVEVAVGLWEEQHRNFEYRN